MSTSSTDPISGDPLLAIGSWVQMNLAPYQNPSLRPPYPTIEERTIGIIKSAYTAQGRRYYQVVWNPGGMRPETGIYTVDQLVALSQQQAQDIQAEMAKGAYTPLGGWNPT